MLFCILISHLEQYCRWIGNSGSGGDPSVKLAHGSSYWSCQTSDADFGTRYDSISPTFTFSKCSKANGVGWSKRIHAGCEPASFAIIDQGYGDGYNGWYDPIGCGVCNQVSDRCILADLCTCLLMSWWDSTADGLEIHSQVAIHQRNSAIILASGVAKPAPSMFLRGMILLVVFSHSKNVHIKISFPPSRPTSVLPTWDTMIHSEAGMIPDALVSATR